MELGHRKESKWYRSSSSRIAQRDLLNESMVRKGLFHISLILVFAVFYFYFAEDHHNLKRKPYRDEELPRQKELEHRGSTRKPGSRETWRDSSASDLAAGRSCTSQYLTSWEQPEPGTCQVRFANGYPVPDPRCTPGGVNPTITVDVLSDPHWRTRSIRNCESSEAQKHIEYRWYGIQKPRINSNENQVCELDHLVPLELGGADGLGNIWPECGPDDVTLQQRFFKRKDRVENYLADQVKTGRLPLRVAQQGIASDWTQYLDQADRWCLDKGRC